jgi:hypothetical protein
MVNDGEGLRSATSLVFPGAPRRGRRPPATTETSKEQAQLPNREPNISVLLENEWTLDVTQTPPQSTKQIHRNLQHVVAFHFQMSGSIYGRTAHNSLREEPTINLSGLHWTSRQNGNQ